MSTAYWLTGDVREVLASMPDNSVDLVLTSPPFLALRSYLPADHPDKAKEIGSEATPGAFIDTLLDLTEEWRRVLTPHGSLCVELGDTYSGSGGAGGDYSEGGMRDGQPMFRQGYVRNDRPNRPPQESPKAYGNGGPRPPRVRRDTGWPLSKSMTLIPESYRWALTYGRNPFNGREVEPWIIRNVVTWCRPNPPVGALGDKFRPATSDMVVACTSRDRWFDLDSVRTPLTEPGAVKRHDSNNAEIHQNENGAPPLDWWQVSTEPYAGSHYATWPRALLTRPIQTMCPRQVCTVCGEPSRRIVEGERTYDPTRQTPSESHLAETQGYRVGFGTRTTGTQTTYTTLGWTDCGHNTFRNGVVLDPFAGSGTTLAVATGHGRDAIGIDLDARNLDLARERVGMWLVEGPPPSWVEHQEKAG